MAKFTAPNVDEVASDLESVKRCVASCGEGELDDGEGNEGIEVRLQVYPSGSWSIHTGDSSYDQDHRGYWGAGFVTEDTDCAELAAELTEEAADHAAQTGADEDGEDDA